MDIRQERRTWNSWIAAIVGLCIAKLVFEGFRARHRVGNGVFRYEARNRILSGVVGEEGVSIDEIVTHPVATEEDERSIDSCSKDHKGGVCPSGYELDERGCCALPMSDASLGEVVVDVGLEIAKGEACSLIIALSPAVFKFLAGEGLTKGAEKAMERAFKALDMAKTGTRVIARMKAKLVTETAGAFGSARVVTPGKRGIVNTLGRHTVRRVTHSTSALAAKMGRKLAATMTIRAGVKLSSMAAKASSVVAAPLIVFDVLSMLLDMGDPRGYNTFAENAIIQQAREVSEYELQKFASEQAVEYPFTFPLSTAFPRAWDAVVTPTLEETYLHRAMSRLGEEHIMMVFEALVEDRNFPDEVSQAIGRLFVEEMRRTPTERDDVVFRALTTGQTVTGVRWVDIGHSKPARGKQLTDVQLLTRLREKRPKSMPNLTLTRAMRRFGGIMSSMTVSGQANVNPFEEDIQLSREEVPLDAAGRAFDFDAYTYVELNGRYFVSSDIGVPGHFVDRCPHMTTAARQGVSLSIEGVQWWNAMHKDEWFEYNDLFQRPSELPEDFVPPPVALWSTEYLVLDEDSPGTSDRPNMKKQTLRRPAALYLPAGHIVAYCEKKRDAAFFGGLMGRDVPDMNAGVDPIDYGVYFDDGTGELGGIGCVYTARYCTRMGLKHRYKHQSRESDCYMDAGQEVSENIFGTTITRGIYEGMHDLFGMVCDPACGVTEYCDGRSCWPKQEYGANVGITAGWKCLSGVERGGVCTECSVAEDCDGYDIDTSRDGVDCSSGECYCNKNTHCARRRTSCSTADKESCDHDMVYCDANNWCESGFCDIVVGEPNVCRKNDSETGREDGEFCNDEDGQCKSGLCAHHKCEPQIPPCTKSECWQRLGSTNEPCHRDADCSGGSYCHRVIGRRNTCRAGATVVNRPNGDYCDDDVQCSGGVCTGSTCEAKIPACESVSCHQTLGGSDQPCNRDEDCEDSVYCRKVAGQRNTCRRSDGNRPEGKYCDSNEQCATRGGCHNSLCRQCTHDEHCGPGKFCNENTCQPKRGVGGLCTRSGECIRGHCDTGRCHECTNNGHCKGDGICEHNKCRSKRKSNERCLSDDWCISGTCAALTEKNHSQGVRHCCNGRGQWYTWVGGPELCTNQLHDQKCTHSEQCAEKRTCHEGRCRNRHTSVSWTPCSDNWWHGKNGGGEAQCRAEGKGTFTGDWVDCGEYNGDKWYTSKVKCEKTWYD